MRKFGKRRTLPVASPQQVRLLSDVFCAFRYSKPGRCVAAQWAFAFLRILTAVKKLTPPIQNGYNVRFSKPLFFRKMSPALSNCCWNCFTTKASPSSATGKKSQPQTPPKSKHRNKVLLINPSLNGCVSETNRLPLIKPTALFTNMLLSLCSSFPKSQHSPRNSGSVRR
jgi:hypothetical protein